MWKSYVFLSLITTSLVGETLSYESITSGESSPSEWILQNMEGTISVQGITKEAKIEMSYSPAYALVQYREVSAGKKELQMTKDRGVLFIASKDRGKERLLSHKIGELPWVQDFKFGFQPFLATDAKKYAFCIIHPDKLDVHDMIAVKDLEESVEIDGKTYEAQRVKISLKGFKKKFWTGYVWFDKENHLMLKYRANKGPGTPYTEILFVGSKT